MTGLVALSVGWLLFSPSPSSPLAWTAALSICVPLTVALVLRPNAATIVPMLTQMALWSVPLILVGSGYERLNGFGSASGGAAMLFLVANLSFAWGLMASLIRRSALLPTGPTAAVPAADLPTGRPRGAATTACVALSVAAAAYFAHSVGGFSAYFSNLNNTGQLTRGLTPVVWLLFFARFAGVVVLNEARTARLARTGILIWVVGMILTLIVGTRLFLVLGLVELLVVLWRRRPRATRRLHPAPTHQLRRFLGFALVILVVGSTVFAVGQFRTDLGLRHAGKAAAPTTTKSFFSSYVNNYSDTTRTAQAVTRLVPRQAPYDDGRRLLQAVTHVLPRQLRVADVRGQLLMQYLGGTRGKGSALPLPTEGFLAFGWAGTVLFMTIAGFVTGILGERWAAQPDGSTNLALLGCLVALLLFLRGSLPVALAFGLLEVVGLVVVQRAVRGPAITGG